MYKAVPPQRDWFCERYSVVVDSVDGKDRAFAGNLVMLPGDQIFLRNKLFGNPHKLLALSDGSFRNLNQFTLKVSV